MGAPPPMTLGFLLTSAHFWFHWAPREEFQGAWFPRCSTGDWSAVTVWVHKAGSGQLPLPRPLHVQHFVWLLQCPCCASVCVRAENICVALYHRLISRPTMVCILLKPENGVAAVGNKTEICASMVMSLSPFWHMPHTQTYTLHSFAWPDPISYWGNGSDHTRLHLSMHFILHHTWPYSLTRYKES